MTEHFSEVYYGELIFLGSRRELWNRFEIYLSEPNTKLCSKECVLLHPLVPNMLLLCHCSTEPSVILSYYMCFRFSFINPSSLGTNNKQAE